MLEALVELNAVSLARTELDTRSLLLVRIAALVAVDAPTSSYLLHVGPSVDAGLTAKDAEDVLIAVAPIVGAPRAASAAVNRDEVALPLSIRSGSSVVPPTMIDSAPSPVMSPTAAAGPRRFSRIGRSACAFTSSPGFSWEKNAMFAAALTSVN